MNVILDFFRGIWSAIEQTLIYKDRWKFYAQGIPNTLFITLMALAIGLCIGVPIAIIKTYHSSTGRLRFFNWLANVYTTVIRGTPVVLQLLIIYYIIFSTAPLSARVFIAALSFGINSGAYVSEIVRAGIQSVDVGQTEAGRSLGLTGGQTMRLIVLPQAVKNILPTLFNEIIALLKETSVVGYVALIDITKAGDIIRGQTYSLAPLLISAGIYLVFVYALTQLQKLIERRLATGDRG